MLQKIKTYIAEKSLFEADTTLIVGLSGGADSMVLLDVLTLLGYRCIAAHCNFHLRGEESDDDARFVKKWCKENDIEFTSIDFDTKQYAADKKISIEMAARELRYSWFEVIRKQFVADAIAVAHHKDDSVETVLLNLIRGTGISGLSGISPKNGKIVRPMLCVTRTEIENYLREREIPFRTDSTNHEDIYTRNHIRLNILPMLQKINPSVSESIFRTSENVAEAEKVYKEAIDNDLKSVLLNDKIDIEKLKQTVSPSSVLFEILSPLGFHPSVIEDVNNAMDASPGKVFYSSARRLIKDRDYFLIDKINKSEYDNQTFLIDLTTQEILNPIRLEIKVTDVPKSIDKSNNILYADADKLSFPLVLRKWQSGDWFIPFGMKGRKKLSDFFTDQKFNLKQKEETWILLSGEDVVWVVGYRSDNRFKITSNTKKVVQIELKNDEIA
ncbi:MAG: tRNA lysidine(34) synthetase TilS [Bacteroidia bacterium]|nr:tRNA lysidine(34) synthetase TilS [Bacteroidia bacterium]